MIVFEKFKKGSVLPKKCRVMAFTAGSHLESKEEAERYWGYSPGVIERMNKEYPSKLHFEALWDRFNWGSNQALVTSGWVVYWAEGPTENEFGVVSP